MHVATPELAARTKNSAIFLEALIRACSSDRNFNIGRDEVKVSG